MELYVEEIVFHPSEIYSIYVQFEESFISPYSCHLNNAQCNGMVVWCMVNTRLSYSF